jgi:hypothetical protein
LNTKKKPIPQYSLKNVDQKSHPQDFFPEIGKTEEQQNEE